MVKSKRRRRRRREESAAAAEDEEEEEEEEAAAAAVIDYYDYKGGGGEEQKDDDDDGGGGLDDEDDSKRSITQQTHRSKHSQTEHRRRTRINHRFQILRDLIPHNDQKRDKASFLLEVIEYIQFLQEKLQTYEGSSHCWTQEPSKLVPWKNHVSAESMMDPFQILKNDSGHDNSDILTSVNNAMESDMSTTAMYKTLDHLAGSTSTTTPFDVPTPSYMFADVGRGTMAAESLQEPVSDAENMANQLQSQLWQVQPCVTESTSPNNAVNGQEELTKESGYASMSSAYSQGILNNLTQALQSFGVDLSQTSISVQIDVINNGAAAGPSRSKDQGERHLDNQLMGQVGVERCI